MMLLIQAVKEWPIIIQGALGSALFWLVLVGLQSLFRLASDLWSKHSRSSRKSYLVSRLTKFQAFQCLNGGDAESAFNVSVLIYRSLRSFFKGIMWLCLGLLLQAFAPLAGIIGFTGCLYYMLKAYEVVKPLREGADLQKEEKKLLDELIQLGVFPDYNVNQQSHANDSLEDPPND